MDTINLRELSLCNDVFLVTMHLNIIEKYQLNVFF